MLSWAEKIHRCYLSVITLEEIRFGLAAKPNNRIAAAVAGQSCGRMRREGQTLTQADMRIAATAIENGYTLFTANTRDFEGCGISVLNPLSS